MKVSVAISLLILVAAIGSQARITRDTKTRNRWRKDLHSKSQIVHHAFQDSSDCCLTYTSRIRCSNIVNYFLTSAGCIQPGVIFLNKAGQRICANPSDQRVRKCMKSLDQNS